jgi:hypothetical protein
MNLGPNNIAKLSPSSALAGLSLALILVSPPTQPPPTHSPTRESRETWNFASAGIPDLA